MGWSETRNNEPTEGEREKYAMYRLIYVRLESLLITVRRLVEKNGPDRERKVIDARLSSNLCTPRQGLETYTTILGGRPRPRITTSPHVLVQLVQYRVAAFRLGGGLLDHNLVRIMGIRSAQRMIIWKGGKSYLCQIFTRAKLHVSVIIICTEGETYPSSVYQLEPARNCFCSISIPS